MASQVTAPEGYQEIHVRGIGFVGFISPDGDEILLRHRNGTLHQLDLRRLRKPRALLDLEAMAAAAAEFDGSPFEEGRRAVEEVLPVDLIQKLSSGRSARDQMETADHGRNRCSGSASERRRAA